MPFSLVTLVMPFSLVRGRFQGCHAALRQLLVARIMYDMSEKSRKL